MIRRLLQHAIAPAVTLLAVGLSAVVAGYATAGGESNASGTLLEPTPAPAGQELTRGLVRQASGDTLTISVGGNEKQFRLGPQTLIEALAPTTLAEISAGDWLNGAAISHAQTLFALTRVVVIAESQVESR